MCYFMLVTAHFSYCDVDCLKVNCKLGDIITDVGERLHPYLAVQEEQQGSYRFMLFAEKELVMVIPGGAANALYALLALHHVMNYEYCGHVVKCLEFIERFFVGISSSAVNAVGELAMQLGLFRD